MEIGPDNVLASDRNWAGVYPLAEFEKHIRKYTPHILAGLDSKQVKPKVVHARERVYNMFYNRKFPPEQGRGRYSAEHVSWWEDHDEWQAHAREILKSHPRRVGRIK